MNLFGRTALYTSFDDITADNVVEAISRLTGTFGKNCKEIDYLYACYKGKQDILYRTKELNDYILNKIVENRFREIVDFHTRYLAGDAIKYSANEQDYANEVDVLNDFCRLEGKETHDYNLVKWYNICGSAFRLILPKPYRVAEDEAPFYLATLDPRCAGVAYTAKIPHVPKICWYVTSDSNGAQTWSVYVRNANGNRHFEIQNNHVMTDDAYLLSELPIIEYPYGEERMSSAEVVLPLCDAVNNLNSNRMDGIEQAIQTLLVLTNCKLPDGMTASQIKELGLIELISTDNKASVEQIATKLDQSNTQTLKEDLLNAIRTIASLPNVSDNTSSGGDNGLAVVYRNGWEGAYESAMGDQKNIDMPEYTALKLMLEICEGTGKLSVPLRAINIDYTRQHYENMATKSQVLISMLNNDKIHPQVAYEVSGLFYDPNKKWLQGYEWWKEHGESEPEQTVETIEGAVIEESGSEETATEV